MSPLRGTRGRRAAQSFSFAERLAIKAATMAAQKENAARTLKEYAELVPEPGVGPLRWVDFPFQEEWYSEEVARAAEVVIAKSAQVGASAYSWRAGVRRADQFGDRVLYVFPTSDHVKEFGDDRIDPAIEASPYLLSRMDARAVKTKTLKRIGAGSLYLRGSNSKAGAQSVAAQMVIFDEYDLLDQDNVAQMERRTSGAKQIGKERHFIRLGYPYTVNAGIDAHFQSSDRRHWHITCKACGTEQQVTWEDNVRWTMPGVVDEQGRSKVLKPGEDVFEDPKTIGDVWRQCSSCAASLEDSGPRKKDGALRKGRWIAGNPDSKIIGFYVWRGMVPVTDLEQLVIASRGTTEREREAFSVLDLGRPYTSGAAQLTDEDLAAAQQLGLERAVEHYTGPNAVVMGIDIGDAKGIHVQIHEQLPPEAEGLPNPRRALWTGTVQSFEEVEVLMVRFNVSVCAADMNPERRAVRSLRAKFPGRVIGVEFATTFNADPLKLDNDPVGIPLRALVNRTDVIDAMMDSIRMRYARPLKIAPPKWAEQMKALHRKTEIDTKGRPVRTYETAGSSGEDYAMAETYALVATEIWRMDRQAFEQMRAAQIGQQVSEDAIGFRRTRLGGGYADADDYYAGMGE